MGTSPATPPGTPFQTTKTGGLHVMKRLLIIADHSFVVQAIRLALRQTSGFQVLGFLDGRMSIAPQLIDMRPEVVLVDDMQDPKDALDRLREISDVMPDAIALLLTTRRDSEWIDQAFEAGAQAVFSKTVHPVALGTLLRECVRGNVIHRPRPARLPEAACGLTSREREILTLATQGYTNSKIARQLWVTEQTVKFHLSNTYRKLGVTNRTEATRYACVNALVDTDAQLVAS
jgi:DNA-binding NarL/FixJ family response regulator